MKNINIIILMSLEYCLKQSNITALSFLVSYLIESDIDKELKISVIKRLKQHQTNKKDRNIFNLTENIIKQLNYKNDN